MTSTNNHRKLQIPELSIDQFKAVELLILGMSDREVAEVVGVRRETVTRWRLYNPIFTSELNQRRGDIWNLYQDRMRSLIPRALDALQEALNDIEKHDRWKIAIEFLKASGLYSNGGSNLNSNVGETNVEALLEAEVYKRRKKEKLSAYCVTQSEMEAVLKDWQEL